MRGIAYVHLVERHSQRLREALLRARVGLRLLGVVRLEDVVLFFGESRFGVTHVLRQACLLCKGVLLLLGQIRRRSCAIMLLISLLLEAIHGTVPEIVPEVHVLRHECIGESHDDEDDEQGWAEMKARKDKKSKTWRLKKDNNTLQELYNAPA